jgi:hypothetical protein
MRRSLFGCALPRWVALWCALLFAGTSRTASADGFDVADYRDSTRLYGGLWLGFGEQAELDGVSTGDDHKRVLGGQFGLDVIGPRHFSLGADAELGAAKWKVGDSAKMIDMALKPRLRLPVDGTPLEFYLTVPVGLTLPRLSDESGGQGRVGWNLGAGGGVDLLLAEGFFLNVEPMWLKHSFKVSSDLGSDVVVKQFALFINAVLDFGALRVRSGSRGSSL